MFFIFLCMIKQRSIQNQTEKYFKVSLPINWSSCWQNGIVFSSPWDSRGGITTSVTFQSNFFIFCNDYGSRRIVADDWWPSDLQFDFRRNFTTRGNQDLTYVKSGIGFLDVFNLNKKNLKLIFFSFTSFRIDIKLLKINHWWLSNFKQYNTTFYLYILLLIYVCGNLNEINLL